MNNTFLDLSGKINKDIIEIYKVVNKVTSHLEIPFFVVGATARDMVLELGYNIEPVRATRDIDLGVKVAGWQEFKKLIAELVDTGKFKKSFAEQRIFYENGLPVDIVPFGEISGKTATIAWPPQHEIEMNVLGFAEAYANAIWIRLEADPDFDVRFASPAGWALLKIISWNDRTGGERIKDALDLSLIMRKYAEAGNEDRLYETEAKLLEEEEFDLEYSGARLLGRDIAAIAKPESRRKIIKILGAKPEGNSRQKLATDMLERRGLGPEEYEKNLHLIQKFYQGIKEG